MTKTKKNNNFAQGKSVAERETGAGWGSPADSAAAVPLDQHHTRRSYVGFGEFPQDTRRALARPGHELERMVTNVSPAQLVHGATRGMSGKRDYPSSGPHIRAVHRFGLGPLVQRVADAGHDPIEPEPVDTDYLHQHGPRSGDLSRYVDAARHVPAPTGYGAGYPLSGIRSSHPVMGPEILAAIKQKDPS